jgi:GAF domain-containing protein
VVHIPDVTRDADYLHQELTRAVGFRSGLFVPMLRDGEPIGVIMVARAEPGPFSESEIELLKTFADQAVIAVENVRLFTELEVRNRDLTETLEQQTATSEILSVISSSPTDVQPVFDTIARNARRLCNADSGSVFTYDGTLVHLQSLDNTSPERSDALRGVYPLVPTLETVGGRAILTRQPVHISDVRDDPAYVLPTLQDAGLRSVLSVPMLRDGLPVGIIIVHTWETPRPFSRTQIDLLKTFADQAVIAIQNVRLFTELEARNRDLTETLEQQTATGEILRVISSSPTDIQPVLDTVAESASRLCDALDVGIFRLDADRLRLVAHHGPISAGPIGEFTVPLVRGTVGGRSVIDARPLQVPDLTAEVNEFPEGVQNARRFGFRTILSVPLLREGLAIGCLQLRRAEVQLFSDRQIALLQTFADQAVIAIENVRPLQGAGRSQPRPHRDAGAADRHQRDPAGHFELADRRTARV